MHLLLNLRKTFSPQRLFTGAKAVFTEGGQLHLGHTLQSEVGLFLRTGRGGWGC